MVLDSGNIFSTCFEMMFQGVENLPEAQQPEATQMLNTLSTMFSRNAFPGGDESTGPSPRTTGLPETQELEDTSEIEPAHQATPRNDEARIGASSMQQMNHQTHRQPQMSCIATDTPEFSPHESEGNTQHAVDMMLPASSGCLNTPSAVIQPWNNFTLEESYFGPTTGSWATTTNAGPFQGFDPSNLDPQGSVNPYLEAAALTQPFSTMETPTRTSRNWNDYPFS